MRWMVFVALFLVSSLLSAVEVPPLPPLKSFHTHVPLVRNGQAEAVIVVPSGPEYAAMAQHLSAAIEGIAGVPLSIRSAVDLSPADLRATHMILLGYFATNPLCEYLYDEFYLAVDASWPGPGGFVLRTLHDPLGAGSSMVSIGGADAAAVNRGVDAFIARLPGDGDLVIPQTILVGHADGSAAYKPAPGAVQRRIEAARSLNFRALAGQLSAAGSGYFRTGNPEDIAVFKELIPLLLRSIRALDVVNDMRGATELMTIWDVIEEAAEFTDADRAAGTELMWELTHRFSLAGAEPEASPVPVGNSWNSRVAVDLGRYWMRYYGIDAGGLHTWAKVRFDSKLAFWRAREDCPGYGGITMYDTLHYALSRHADDFWQNGIGKAMADYGVAVINNLGGHAGFGDTSSLGNAGQWPLILRLAGWKLRDGRYLHAAARCHLPESGSFFAGRYIQSEIAAQPPADLFGIHVVPLPDWVYDHRETVLGTAPPELNEVLAADPLPPRQACFDKITFRNSMNPEEEYLILGGISHGYHAHPDGNAIIEMTAAGRYGLFDSGYFVPDTVEHNTVLIYRNGLFEPIPRLTGLAALADFPDTGLTQTYLADYNGVTWRRNILWRKGRYFLVLDEAEALEPGDYSLHAVFRTFSDEAPVLADDTIRTRWRGNAFRLVHDRSGAIQFTGTTPPAGYRHAVIQTRSANLQPGERLQFANLLAWGEEPEGQSFGVVKAGAGSFMVRSPDGISLVGSGDSEPLPGLRCTARVFALQPAGAVLADGTALVVSGQTWLAADAPVNLDLRHADGQLQAVIETKQTTRVTLAGRGPVQVDGRAITPEQQSQGSVTLTLTPGTHQIRCQALDGRLETVPWDGEFERLAAHARQTRDAVTAARADSTTLKPRWTVDVSRREAITRYLDAQGQARENLAGSGRPMTWTEAQRGARPGNAFDGNPETYAATPSRLAWTADLPKDIGVEWAAPVRIGSVQLDFYNAAYAPADDGYDLQAWSDNAWVSLRAERTVDESGANWQFSLDPAVETSRIRLFITRFAEMRTAVREMRVFAAPVQATPGERRVPLPVNDLAVADLYGDGMSDTVAVAGNRLLCIAADGATRWEHELTAPLLCLDIFDLDQDGTSEIVVGSQDSRLRCFRYDGQLLWDVETPADAFTPDREPMRGPIRVLRCADIDGDGKGEIVLGSGNWFAYAYDAAGTLRWSALNWAHMPTSIAWVPLAEQQLGALIGTTYNDANLFGADGRLIARVSVGYHGAAMSVATGDLDGNDAVDMVVGSRVGAVHRAEHGADAAWIRFLGAEVSRVILADLDQDGLNDIVAGSRNHHVIAFDKDGETRWVCNVGAPVLDLVTLDMDGNGMPHIAAASETGRVVLIDAAGTRRGQYQAPGSIRVLAVSDSADSGRQAIVAGSSDGVIYGPLQ